MSGLSEERRVVNSPKETSSWTQKFIVLIKSWAAVHISHRVIVFVFYGKKLNVFVLNVFIQTTSPFTIHAGITWFIPVY